MMNDSRLDCKKLERLVEFGETDTVEFKEKVDIKTPRGRTKILSRILGLANTRGGNLIIGVGKRNGDYEIVGTDIDKEQFQSKVENWVNDFVDPVGLLVSDIYNVKGEKGTCIVVEVDNVPGVCFGLRMESRQEKEKTAYELYVRQSSITERWDPLVFFRVAHVNFLAGISRLAEEEREDIDRIPVYAPGLEDRSDEAKENMRRHLDTWDTVQGPETKKKLLELMRTEMLSVFRGEINEDVIEIAKRIFPVIDECLEETGEKRMLGLSILSLMDSKRDGVMYDMAKERYEDKILDLFNGELEDEERKEIFRILMSLKDGEKEYLESMTWEMVDDWDESRMKLLSGTIHHWLYEKGDSDIKTKLWQRRDEAERNGEIEKLERIINILKDVYHE